jgi:hypothetical protein
MAHFMWQHALRVRTWSQENDVSERDAGCIRQAH